MGGLGLVKALEQTRLASAREGGVDFKMRVDKERHYT